MLRRVDRGCRGWWSGLIVAGMLLSAPMVVNGALERTKGVHPSEHRSSFPQEDKGLYTADSFQCKDGSRTISLSRVNDDYCDCDDGSDEPGTSACPNGKFWCENKGHESKHIFSSRVNDGFCEEGEERRKHLIEQIELHEQGLLKVPDYVDAAERYRTNVEARNKELTAQIAEKQAEVDTKKARQTELQKVVPEPERKKKPKDAGAKASDKIARSREERRKRREERRKKREGRAGGGGQGEGMVDEADAARKEEEERKKAEANVDPEAKMTPEELAEAKAKAWEEFKAAKERGDVAEDGEGVEEGEEEVAVAAAEDDIGAAEAEPQAPQQQEEAPVEDEVKEDPHVAEARLELDEIKKELRPLEADVRKLRDELAVTETVLGGDFGRQGEFLALFHKCFSQHVQQYTYELCVFQKATQKEGSSSQNLGVWGEWNKEGEPYSEMLYHKGGGCWNGPARTMRVTLVCGADEFIVSVQEPSKCAYTMEFMTPLACRRSKVTEAMAELEAAGFPY